VYDVFDTHDVAVSARPACSAEAPATGRKAMQLDATTLERHLGHRLRALPDLPLSGGRGVRFHSDRVRPGDVFVAMAGATQHGERFADDALARGAAFVLTDRPRPGAVVVDDAGAALLDLGHVARAARRGPVIGITGSVGKTTTKALLAAALDGAVSPGNLNTPHALATVLVDGWLAGDLDRPLVLELGIDHVGEMARLLDLVHPDHALLTAIAPAHLAGLGDVATVAREKGRLLHAAAGSRVVAESAWRQLPPELRTVTLRYRLIGPTGAAADASAEEEPSGDEPPIVLAEHVLGETNDHLRIVPSARAGALEREIDVALPGLGRALAENALGALTLAFELGVEPAIAAERLAHARLEPHRLTRHRLGEWTLLDDTYNAGPPSMREALAVLKRLPAPHAAVLGSMLELGPSSPDHHTDLGLVCAGLDLDAIWTVGADARAIAEACPGARHLPDTAAAIAAAADLPRRGTLLVKGSRGIGLEALVAHLLATSAAPA
jgi:UDP-N-acetylmuramoyl-tripeptide--D-alanyl-D-alanine ligase